MEQLMDFEKLNKWLQVSANIGIVLGLVLVGIQLRQNSDLARIQLLYEESNRAIDLETAVVGEQSAAVWAKSIEAPEDLTLAEIRIMEALLWSFVEQLRRVIDDVIAGDSSTVKDYITQPQRTLQRELEELTEFATGYS